MATHNDWLKLETTLRSWGEILKTNTQRQVWAEFTAPQKIKRAIGTAVNMARDIGLGSDGTDLVPSALTAATSGFARLYRGLQDGKPTYWSLFEKVTHDTLVDEYRETQRKEDPIDFTNPAAAPLGLTTNVERGVLLPADSVGTIRSRKHGRRKKLVKKTDPTAEKAIRNLGKTPEADPIAQEREFLPAAYRWITAEMFEQVVNPEQTVVKLDGEAVRINSDARVAAALTERTSMKHSASDVREIREAYRTAKAEFRGITLKPPIYAESNPFSVSMGKK